MISVIIPARNAARTIGATLASLAGDKTLIQEILLIDDDSDDDTVSSAQQAAKQHSLPLSVTRVQLANAGAARNAGLAQVRGSHVFYLDADDEVLPGALTLLHDALVANPEAGLAVGSSIHRASRGDKLKVPSRYSDDRRENARKYLANELRSIAIGSALIDAGATAGVRFPETIGLDEDTLYWAAVLTRVSVVTIRPPVLHYNLDEARMVQRFVSNPRKVFLDIALELNRLAAFGIEKGMLQKRKAFIALRIARQLIRQQRYVEAAGMLRVVQGAGLKADWKAIQYRLRIAAGLSGKSSGHPKADRRRITSALHAQSGRTLILTSDPVFPPVSGADLRNYQNARAAVQFGPVLLVSAKPGNGYASTDNGITIASLARHDDPGESSLVSRRTSIEPRIPRSALPRLLALVRKFRPDRIVVEGVPLFAMLKHLRPLTQQLILDMHNVESELAGQVRPAGKSAKKLLPFRWSDEGRIRKIEREALQTVDRVWVCSEEDRERLTRLIQPGIPVDVVPNGIPRAELMPAELPPLPGTEGDWPVLLFVGHLGYAPNVTAAERLARTILPLVRKDLPTARLILAGRCPKPSVQKLAGLPGVELVANPEELGPLLSFSHIAAMPLAAGGGTRIKILEAMAWGLPVVATSVAAEGQGFRHGHEILIAESDEEMAKCVVELCQAPERVDRQRRLAYEGVMLRYGPAAIAQAVRAGFPMSGT